MVFDLIGYYREIAQGASPEEAVAIVSGGGTTPPPTPPTPIPPPPQPPPIPQPPQPTDTPYEGELRYFNNILYKLENGQWIPQESDVEEPEGFAPTAPGQDLEQSPYPVGSPEWMEDVYGYERGFKPAYMTALGMFGKQGRTPYQRYQERLFDPLNRLWGLQQQFAGSGMEGYDPWTPYASRWMEPYAQNPFAMYAQARGMMGDVAGMSTEQRAGFGLQGATPALQDLTTMGLRSKLGLVGAGWVGQQLPQAEEAWMAQYPQAGAGMEQEGAGAPSFMDYVMKKYNLSRFL